MEKVTIYTDGACSGNPGIGGWAAILKNGDYQKILSGGEKDTTNNRMELLGVINGLEALKQPCEVEIYSDSAYVINAFLQDWISYWVLNYWTTKSKKPVQNVELWKRLLEACKPHHIKWFKVKGHADNELNNLCDQIAREQISKIKSSN